MSVDQVGANVGTMLPSIMRLIASLVSVDQVGANVGTIGDDSQYAKELAVSVDQVGANVGTRRPSNPLLALRFRTAVRA